MDINVIRELFEQKHTMPANCIWVGTGYASTQYGDWKAQDYCHLFDGFKDGFTAAITLECKKSDADIVVDMLSCGEWELTKNHPHDDMTDEWNLENSWTVRRLTVPFCDQNNTRFWSGKTALEALQKADRAIKG